MVIQSYFNKIKATLDRYAIINYVLDSKADFEVRAGDQGYLYGSISFIDGSILYFKEFLDGANETIDKLTYSYHYQNAESQLIFRYDNAAHKPPLPLRQQKHLPQQILPALAPTLVDVLPEIFTLQSQP